MDQVLVSGQFLISSQGCFSMSLGYDGRFGGGSQVNEVNVALDWKFKTAYMFALVLGIEAAIISSSVLKANY